MASVGNHQGVFQILARGRWAGVGDLADLQIGIIANGAGDRVFVIGVGTLGGGAADIGGVGVSTRGGIGGDIHHQGNHYGRTIDHYTQVTGGPTITGRTVTGGR